jgi:hypothetical protein
MARTRAFISAEGDYISGPIPRLIKALSALPVDNFLYELIFAVSLIHENRT